MTEQTDNLAAKRVKEEAENAAKKRDLIPTVVHVVEVLNPHNEALAQMQEQLGRAVIADVESYRKGEEGLIFLKRLGERVSRDQEDLIGPLKEFTRWVDARFRTVKDVIDILTRNLKTKMIEFKNAEDRRAREEAEAARREQEERALEAASKAKSPALADAIIDAAIEAPPPTSELRGMGTSTPKRWVGSLVNVKALCQAVVDGHIPTELISVGQADLNAFAKRKETEGTFYGIKVEHKTTMTVRG